MSQRKCEISLDLFFVGVECSGKRLCQMKIIRDQAKGNDMNKEKSKRYNQ